MKRSFSGGQKHSSVPYARRRLQQTLTEVSSVIPCLSERNSVYQDARGFILHVWLLHQKFQLYEGRNPREHRNILQSPSEPGVFVYK